MLQQELKSRNLPELKSREEMIEILQNEIYGKKLSDPEKLEFIKEDEPMVPRFCANKASIYKVIANNMNVIIYLFLGLYIYINPTINNCITI